MINLLRTNALRVLTGIAAGLSLTSPALAEWGLNMPRGVTPLSKEMYDLHMLIFLVCVAIAVLVFGFMIYSIVAFRHSKGAVPETFSHNTTAEIAWTVIPVIILVLMAVPAAKSLVRIEDTRASDISIKITGYQWKWHYQYLDEGFGFFSSLDAASNAARQVGSGIDPTTVEHYLRNVDKRVVVPVNKKVRLLLTSNDVIHAWWVPELGGKRDAIPGYVNELWFKAEETGTYRGQCAELCGRDHGFMPIVVDVVSEPEYMAWVAGQGGGAMAAAESPQTATSSAAPVAVAAAPAPVSNKTLTMAQLMANGESAYLTSCGACHQATGKGMPPAFPSLLGSPSLTGPVSEHLNVVLNGRPGTSMIGFASQLDDETIAAIITYERNAWGQSTGDMLQPADVRAAR